MFLRVGSQLVKNSMHSYDSDTDSMIYIHDEDQTESIEQ